MKKMMKYFEMLVFTEQWFSRVAILAQDFLAHLVTTALRDGLSHVMVATAGDAVVPVDMSFDFEEGEAAEGQGKEEFFDRKAAAADDPVAIEAAFKAHSQAVDVATGGMAAARKTRGAKRKSGGEQAPSVGGPEILCALADGRPVLQNKKFCQPHHRASETSPETFTRMAHQRRRTCTSIFSGTAPAPASSACRGRSLTTTTRNSPRTR